MSSGITFATAEGSLAVLKRSKHPFAKASVRPAARSPATASISSDSLNTRPNVLFTRYFKF